MKKGILLLISCLLFGVNAMAQIEPVQGVTLTQTALDLPLESKYTLSATITPGNATNDSVIWTSSDSAKVDIISTGYGLDCIIKALTDDGSITTITVTTVDGGHIATCAVTAVLKRVTSISLTERETLTVNDSVLLSPTILPADAANKNLTWDSKDISIATVTDGKVKALAAGNTFIVATTTDGSNLKDSCEIIVNALIQVDSVTLNIKDSVVLLKGANDQLTATIHPSNASNNNVSWNSSVPGVVSVSSTGVISALNQGSSIITVTTQLGSKSASCKVVVKDTVYVTGIALDKQTLTLHVDSINTIKASFTPPDATNKKVKFSTSNSSIVEITSATTTTTDTDCKIKAKSAGTATITVTTDDGNKTASCTVTVPPIPITKLQLEKDTVSLGVNDSITLKYTLTPANTTDKTVNWAPGNSNIATVSDAGVVKAKAIGKTYIYATSATVTTLKDSCLIEVTAAQIPVTGVTIADSVSIVEGDTVQLVATIAPANASNKNVRWTIDSKTSSFATIANGVVTGVKAGKTWVYVETVNGSKKDTCIVNVRPKVIFTDPTPATNSSGSFPLSLNAPDDEDITGEFTITFPTGISLDATNTKLLSPYNGSSSLKITSAGSNAWKIEIKEGSVRSATLRASSQQKIMNIAYTIAKTTANGNYNIRITNAAFKFSDNTELKEEKMNVKLKVNIDNTGNDLIDNDKATVYREANRLYVKSDQAETIYIYSFNGTLLYTNIKDAGEIVFDLNIQEPIIIVKGSSGWTKKVAK